MRFRSASTRAASVSAATLVVLTLGACISPAGSPPPSDANPRGGTVRVLLDTPVAAWDPQRITSGPQVPESALASRLFLRTLTAQAPPLGSGVTGLADDLVPDLATSVGEVSDNGRTWSFTLAGGALWQDERIVTCDDVKYGVSRNFARSQADGGLTGGTPYAVSLLDIPTVKDASGQVVSAYDGPYSGQGQALFDRAVSCLGQTITFRLKAPTYDFDQVVSLPAFAPVRRDHDLRADGTFAVFSCGPYMLEGDWAPGDGGRFVRTRSWLAYLDPFRLGLPDVIDVREGLSTASAIQRIIDGEGDDRYAVTTASAPPAIARQLLAGASTRQRTTSPDTPTVDYLAPSFRSRVMSNAKARLALAMATDRTAYVSAYGGSTLLRPTAGLLPTSVPGYAALDPFGVGLDGNAARAKALLVQSGLTLPVPIRVAYPSSGAADSAFEGLKSGWERAGFAVTLAPIGGDYSSAIRSAGAATSYDVLWASWSAAWPSGSAVIPPIADSAASTSTGGNVGRLSDAGLDAAIEAALASPDADTRNAAWGALDVRIARTGDIVALAQRRAVFVHGAGIGGYSDNSLIGGDVDLARIRISVTSMS